MNRIALALAFSWIGLWPMGETTRRQRVQNLPQNKGAVQIEYVCSGPRESIFSDESRDGVWLRLTNNSRRPLFIRTYRQQKTKNSCARKAGPEVGIQYEVVEKRSFAAAEREISELPFERLKPGTNLVIKLQPHKSILFSVAREHLTPNRAIYLNFWYAPDAYPKQLSRAYFYAFQLPNDARGNQALKD